MKNKINVLKVRVLGIIAFIAVFTLSAASCYGQTINSADALKEYLDNQPANSPDKPIKVSMGANDLMLPKIAAVLKDADKYVSLNLTGNTLTTIPDKVFIDCKTLVSIIIPNSVTSIGINAFYYKTVINVNTANTTYSSQDGILYNKAKTTLILYPAGKTGNTFTIPNSVTSIGDRAFSGCESLASVTIPNSVTSIGEYAFYSSSLTSITIPNSVTIIGDSAFYWCKKLISVTIPNSVTSIGASAFSNCKSLTSVTIPNSVTSIGVQAFYECTSLTSITIPNSVTSIGDDAFSGCTSLTSVTIPNSVTSIGNGAFFGCTSLTSVTIPNSVTSIEKYAFNGCTSLTSITIPNSVTSIEKYAFNNCTSLTSITIPASVTSIGGYAFTYCNSLVSVTFQGKIKHFGTYSLYGELPFSEYLCKEYFEGGIGTYKLKNGRWTKQ